MYISEEGTPSIGSPFFGGGWGGGASQLRREISGLLPVL